MWGNEAERGGMSEKKTQKERGNITREKIRGNDKKDMEKKSSDRTQKRHF